MSDMPPPPGGMPPVPPPGGGFVPPAAPYGGVPSEHPYGVWMIVLSVLGLCCCLPAAIASLVWSLIERKKYPGDSKVTIAMVISIVALVWTAVLVVYSLMTGNVYWDVSSP